MLANRTANVLIPGQTLVLCRIYLATIAETLKTSVPSSTINIVCFQSVLC
jgi:hypothetical protein